MEANTRASLANLIQLLPIAPQPNTNSPPNGEPKLPSLLLHIDEVQTMQVHLLHDDKRRTNYSAFTRVVDSFKDQPTLAIFSSTASRLYELAPPRSVHESDRVIAHDTIPLPTWELPFDANLGEAGIEKGSLTLEEITSIAHVVRFGRPL